MAVCVVYVCVSARMCVCVEQCFAVQTIPQLAHNGTCTECPGITLYKTVEVLFLHVPPTITASSRTPDCVAPSAGEGVQESHP